MLKYTLLFVGIASVGFLSYSEAKEDQINEKVCHSEAEIKTVMRELVREKESKKNKA